MISGTAAAPSLTVPPVLPICNTPVLLLGRPGLVGMAATVSVRPGATFHCCNAPGAMKMVLFKTKSAVAFIMSMPAAPLVSVLPAAMVTVAPGSRMEIPAADISPPRVAPVLAALTVWSQRIISLVPGTALLTQEPGSLSGRVLSDLVKISARASGTVASAARKTKSRRIFLEDDLNVFGEGD